MSEARESFAAGLVGIVLDERYRLDALVGEGGMGAVFRATHLAMDRKVAVKLLKPHLTTDQTQLQRFAREARSTLKVDSPHAVKVLDFGVTPLRDYYIVLEYLDGRTVQRELDVDGPFAPARAVHIVRQALHALGVAHACGLVHRDVKPDNIVLMRVGTDPDYAKVLDFGVAKLMQGSARSDQSALALTQMGMVFGTPEFMSPEQACGQTLDGRSDLYSLAATLFAMLTGCGLFEGKSPIEWLTHHARTPPPRLAMVQPALAAYPALDEVLQLCLAKQRDRRPRTAEEMDALLADVAPALGSVKGGPPPTATALKATKLSPSSYVPALAETPPSSTAAITANERPPVRATSERPAAVASGLGTSSLSPIRHGRRYGVLLALGAIAIVSMIGVAVGIMLSRRTRTADLSPPRHVVAPPPVDAAPPVDAVEVIVDAPVVVDASAAPPRPPRPARTNQAERKAELEEHLRAAEDARRAGNHLKQLSEADVAFHLDPRNQAARFLLGDALIKGDDLEKGCKHLRALKRNPKAQAIASAAGCPTD